MFNVDFSRSDVFTVSRDSPKGWCDARSQARFSHKKTARQVWEPLDERQNEPIQTGRLDFWVTGTGS
jgi:hypothetical protein